MGKGELIHKDIYMTWLIFFLGFILLFSFTANAGDNISFYPGNIPEALFRFDLIDRGGSISAITMPWWEWGFFQERQTASLSNCQSISLTPHPDRQNRFEANYPYACTQFLEALEANYYETNYQTLSINTMFVTNFWKLLIRSKLGDYVLAVNTPTGKIKCVGPSLA